MNAHTSPKAKTIKSRTRTHYRDTLVFTQQTLWQHPAGCSGTFYLIVEDVDHYYQQIKHRAEIAWPLQNMPHGSREFGVRDCNGYYLAFSQHQAR